MVNAKNSNVILNALQYIKDNAVSFFMGGFLLISIYNKFMGTFNDLTGIPTQYATYLYYGILWAFLALYFFSNIKKATFNLICVAAVLVFICMVQSLIYPQNIPYIWNFDLLSIIIFSSRSFFGTAMFIVVGLCVDDHHELCNILHKYARVGIVLAVAVYVMVAIFSLNLNYDDMVFSYAICFMACILIAYRQKWDILFIIAAAICIFIAGTRGPIVCLALAIIAKTIFLEKDMVKKIAYITIGSVVVVVMLTGLIDIFMNAIGDLLGSFGFTDLRLLDYYESGAIAETSGRDTISDIVWAGIWENPIFGYGIGGDRVIRNEANAYSHNIVLELFASFGVILGGILFLLLVIVSMRLLFSGNRNYQVISIAFFFAIVVKLMFSSTMLASAELFMFIGLCIAGLMRCSKKDESTRCLVNE